MLGGGCSSLIPLFFIDRRRLVMWAEGSGDGSAGAQRVLSTDAAGAPRRVVHKSIAFPDARARPHGPIVFNRWFAFRLRRESLPCQRVLISEARLRTMTGWERSIDSTGQTRAYRQS
jgi:hypothetical protein